MSISPNCDLKNCGKQLEDFGAILLSPPEGDENQDVKKFHICKECYQKISEEIL